ncbi:PH domain-containing protein [Actinocrinis puniceicyclus]|uniref:PH domain-containing protein n=1 Tax=Actinocrinis puniceicyclus TaxID=977794 RepID=A0A8J7WLB4_9ACTN|nr:PH domain-containing protein [Actinocrinis puniceicyclus]MBS2964436.1 PH domain-containing protein [Actinocrinis puniceicyclus]
MTMFPSIASSQAPGHIRKFLDPDEKVVIHTRFHWASLIQPVALAVVGVFVTIAVNVSQPVRTGSALNVAWLLWGLWVLWALATVWDIRKAMALRKADARAQLLAAVIVGALAYGIAWLVQNKLFGVGGMLLIVLLVVLGWAALQIGEWADRFFVLTNKRIVVIEGIISTTVRSMPVSRLTDMAYRRSGIGRALGYGLFDVESAGQDQALKIMNHVPRPEYTNLQISHLLFASPKPDPKNIVIGGQVSPHNGNVSLTGQMDG